MLRKVTTISLIVLLGIASGVFAAGPDGAAIYKAKCAMCHGASGAGDTPIGKSMKVRDLRSADVQKMTDVELTKIIAGGKGKMPAQKLTTAEVEAVIAYIRTLKAK
jgi:mono/diheme cytochrome c family protein